MVVRCTNMPIAFNPNPDMPGGGVEISRENLGKLVVALDSVVMVGFLLFVWLLAYFLRVNEEHFHHDSFETHEFAWEFRNLPQLSEEFSAEMLKAELV